MINNNLYNRELSWLSFNYRVLQEAKDPSVPLYERIKFLAIYSSNLDEFFRVRVASLRSLLRLKKKTQKKLDFEPTKLIRKIHKTVQLQQEEFGNIYREQILPLLEQQNIFILNNDQISPQHRDYLNEFYLREIKPLIQPVLFSKKIEPFLQNKSIYLTIRLASHNSEQEKGKRFSYAFLEIPSDRLGRFIVLPGNDEKKHIIFIDDVIRIFLPGIFPGYRVESAYSVKLTRDAELYIDDEFAGDLLEKIKKGLSKRKTGLPSRFLYDSKMPKDFLKYLRSCIHSDKDDLIPGGKYHNFNDFFSFPNLGGIHLEYEPLPELPSKILDQNNSMFNAMSEKDILLHYPFQSYNYVIKFIEEAANDDNVTSIYITLYRVASNSKIVQALSKAASKGKKVTAFVEVKARFDEESNFSCAEELQKNGVKVHYSFPGLKVHAKVCLITRIENDVKTYYAYLATGNFNEKTSRIYSDFGLFTKDQRLVKEARKVFNILTKKKNKEHFSNLLVAPFNLRSSLNELIQNEINNANSGKKSYIILKVNSLEDRKMINRLYKASEAGVKIDLIIRGISCLIPGVKNLSKKIRAVSIIDRFLEHARIFIFCNNGDEKYYLSSADLMKRNLSRRIEICFPVYDEDIKKEIRRIINIQLNDNVKGRILNRFQNNKYRKTKASKKIRSQHEIYNYIKQDNTIDLIDKEV